jgi:SAM-dependent methyltransferase
MENLKIDFLSDPTPLREKERLYLEVRNRERRVLADEVVKNLPIVSPSSVYAREWAWRRRSLARFVSHCKRRAAARDAPFRILDLGCGNGWFANRLAENPNWEVWAADVNEAELAQGARLFGRENLKFAYADVLSLSPSSDVATTPFGAAFDVVVLAASVQYFPDLAQLVFSLKKCLKPSGEIHLLDSPFYRNENERMAARRRTLEYYSKIGVPQMAAFYHHHLWSDVANLGGENLNNRLKIKFLQKVKWLAPFPWVKMWGGFANPSYAQSR